MSKIYEPHKSSLGVDANLLSSLIYIIPIILSIVLPKTATIVAVAIAVLLLVLEKDSGLVRYHACMSLILLAITVVLSVIIGIAGVLAIGNQVLGGSFNGVVQGVGTLFFISMAISVFIIVLNCIAAFKSFKWTSVRFPLIGKWAASLTKEQK